MHEVDNKLPPFSLARFFLAQRLIYKSKIEKHDASLYILYQTPVIAKNLHLSGLEKKHFSYIRSHTHFLDHILVFLLLKNKERLIIRALSQRQKLKYLH